MLGSAFEQFVTLFVVIDPIGTIPVFVAATAGAPPEMRKRIAFRAALTAIGILLFFLVLGQFLLEGLGIGLPSFQIAGGIVLFLFALSMIFAQSKVEAEMAEAEAEARMLDKAVFPLAVPSIASPGAMLAIVLLTDNNRFGFAEQAVTGGLMLLVIGIVYLCMRLADPILRIIKESGAMIVSRVMGMILAAVAVDAIIAAVFELIATGG